MEALAHVFLPECSLPEIDDDGPAMGAFCLVHTARADPG